MNILVQVSDLVANIRVLSGLRSNSAITDDEIVIMINDAWNEQHDTYIKAISHWFRADVPFKLAGNTSTTNQFDLTMIPTLTDALGFPLPPIQMDQGLNFWPSGTVGVGSAVTVQRLGSFAERNNVGIGILGLGFGGALTYFTNGDTLFVQPYQQSAGAYDLIYTPQAQQFSLPQPVPPTVPSVPATINAIGQGAGGISVVSFNGANWPSTDVGGTLTIANSAQGNNGSYPIVAAGGANVQLTANLTAESIAGPTATFLPQFTRSDVPQAMSPWVLYLKIHAAIAIKESRNQLVNDLERKLAAQTDRIVAMAKQRSEGRSQAPITNWRRRRGPAGYWA